MPHTSVAAAGKGPYMYGPVAFSASQITAADPAQSAIDTNGGRQPETYVWRGARINEMRRDGDQSPLPPRIDL